MGISGRMVPFPRAVTGGSSIVLLPATPASVAVARRRLAADLIAAGVFDAVIGDVAVVISELLSVAIRPRIASRPSALR